MIPREVAYFRSPGPVEPGNKYILREWGPGEEAFWGRPREIEFDTYTEAVAESVVLAQFYPWCVGRLEILETRPQRFFSWVGASHAELEEAAK